METNSREALWPAQDPADRPEKPFDCYLSGGGQLASAAASYVLARGYVGLFSAAYPAVGAVWFTAAFLLWGSLVFRLREARGAARPSAAVRREAAFWAVCTLAVPAALAMGRARAAGGWAFFLWHGFAAYWVLCRGGMLTQGNTGACFALDAAAALLREPLRHRLVRTRTLGSLLRGAFSRRRDPAQRHGWAAALPFVLAAVPFLCMAGALLCEADDGFSLLMDEWGNRLRPDFGPDFWVQAWLLAASLPVGAYLYGLVAGTARAGGPVRTMGELRARSEHCRRMPAAAGAIILSAFCALYLLFFAVQGSYLFGAFSGRMPADFSAARYARQGFYELCGILVLNFGLLTACARLCRQPLRRLALLRGLSLLLMGQSLLFCATVFSKICLYIAIFGFTPRRLLSAWAVTVFAAAAVLAVSTLIRPHRAVQKWVWFSAASFAVLCFLY